MDTSIHKLKSNFDDIKIKLLCAMFIWLSLSVASVVYFFKLEEFYVLGLPLLKLNHLNSKMDSSSKSTSQWTEFRMNVPWGHIAGKWWGPQDVRPILVLHGWQDNAGSFDPLIPMLSSHLSYLAIDLPGHGLSSHIPEGMMIHFVDFVNVVLLIVKQMKWKKVSILGHSMGGVIGLWFSAMFTDLVDMLIVIDVLKPPQFGKEVYWEYYGKMISTVLLIEERTKNGSEPPSYTLDECAERLSIGAAIDKDKCKYIVARNAKESKKYPGKYYFARDERLKVLDNGNWPHDYYVAMASQIKIPFLFIKAMDVPRNEPTENFNGIIAELKKNPLFQFAEVRGRHHVHLNQPENVRGVISEFLNKYADEVCKKSKL